METTVKSKPAQKTDVVQSREAVLAHWQGHRSLTRRMIEAFPDDKLFTFSVGGMRPFGELVLEMIHMAGPGIVGIATGKWSKFGDATPKPTTKKELLELWDKDTATINEYWSKIPAGRFEEKDLAFGQWEGPVHWILFYSIDNEIHHRGQGYVYLRALGIEPPAFWDR